MRPLLYHLVLTALIGIVSAGSLSAQWWGRPDPSVTLRVDMPNDPEDEKVAIRTNLLYDAALVPTFGVQWRVNELWSVKLDGSLSLWDDSKGKVQKIGIINPEVRYHPLENNRRFYVGLSGNYGAYNVHGGMLGDLISKNTGHQGRLYGGGATVGYRLPLWSDFSLDFNLGLGFTRLEYDTFTILEGVRVYQERDKIVDFLGPTQAGIHFIWTIGWQ